MISKCVIQIAGRSNVAWVLILLVSGCCSFDGSRRTRSERVLVAEHFVNSIGMTFLHAPAGGFWMGSRPEEKERFDNEVRHRVTISRDFYLAATAVTVKQFGVFASETGFQTAA